MTMTAKQLALAIAGAGLLTIYGCADGGGTSTTDMASLPANLLGEPALSNCAAVRSGRYNQILLVPSGPSFPDKVKKVVIDAVAGTVTDISGSGTITASDEACHSTISGGTDFVVSPAGVMVMRFGQGTTKYLAISVPEQKFTLADMAGTWNSLGMDSAIPGANQGTASSVTFNSAGAVTAIKQCRNAATWDVTNCVDVTTGLPSLAGDLDGGFFVLDATKAIMGRMFAYKAGNGDVMAAWVTTSDQFNLFTRQRSNSLPAVGAVTTHWNLQMDSLLTSPSAATAFSNTILSVDPTAASWVHSRKTVGATDAHRETLFANKPRDGYTFRPAGTALAADGTTATFGEFTSLDFRGMGLSVLLLPAEKGFSFSVAQP
ncbi:MAG: hypothetical protein A3E79_03515 [Burkholderiales bacterium RIFCSPHIGHO2_12_FULL_61_11]|nr:MAG: hypothetical protein A3E79_03515 [Burkholderiales bacterium RIFCSPHIGHO2_12_FULL_61_11]